MRGVRWKVQSFGRRLFGGRQTCCSRGA